MFNSLKCLVFEIKIYNAFNHPVYILGTLHWVEKLKWKNADTWKNSNRNSLVIKSIIEGYLKVQDNFRMYWVNRAGHMVRIYKALSLFPLSFHIYYKPQAIAPRLIYYKENPRSIRNVHLTSANLNVR